MSKVSVKESYVTPEVFSLEMNLEGVLCGSDDPGTGEDGNLGDEL
jgi:hypothetical protein